MLKIVRPEGSAGDGAGGKGVMPGPMGKARGLYDISNVCSSVRKKCVHVRDINEIGKLTEFVRLVSENGENRNQIENKCPAW